MSIEEYLHLCVMSYANLPGEFLRKLKKGGFPLSELAAYFLENGTDCGALDEYGRSVAVGFIPSAIQVIGYVNLNGSTGFCGYTFLTKDGEVIVAMRGSESPAMCAPNYVDWEDNFMSPFVGSRQYGDVYGADNRVRSGRLTVIGHSKGGHNALYGAAVAENPEAKGVVFNAQGFAKGQLTEAQSEKLRARAVNYVVAGDIVGALLDHPERRFYVEKRGDQSDHMPQSYAFYADGSPVPAQRKPITLAVEYGSKIALSFIKSLRFGGKIREKTNGEYIP